MESNVKKSNYNGNSIKHYEGVVAVQKRPGMYIGEQDRKGLHHLIYEIVDNSTDEALAGFCKNIEIKFLENNFVQITDDGRGIPVDESDEGESALLTAYTKLHAGGKFDNNAYKVSGGLHGVGATVVNALSEELEITVKRDGKIYHIKFENGAIAEPLKEIGETDFNDTGTIVKFKPNPKYFPNAEEEADKFALDPNFIKPRVKRTAYLTPKLRLKIIDVNGHEDVFYSENGIRDCVKDLSETFYSESTLKDMRKHDIDVLATDIMYFEGEMKDEKDPAKESEIEIAFTYQNKYFSKNILSFANNIATYDGGRHVVGFENAVLKVVNDFYTKEKKGKLFLKEDVLSGLNAVISYRVGDPSFSDQTKRKLGTTHAQTLAYQATKDFLENEFSTNPTFLEYMITKSEESRKIREQIDKKRNEIQKASNVNVFGDAKKLADCTIKEMKGTELFIVEGDSAGGAAKQGRDRKYQAILPLKGKIANSMKHEISKIRNSDEIKSLVASLRTGSGKDFNINNLRYERLIIMTDADVDGAHIETLVLTYLNTDMRDLIINNHVYIAQPPLYVLKTKKSFHYLRTEEEYEKFLVNGVLPQGYTKQRFKGLGEMNPTELWDTTMNPETRTLLQVVYDPSKQDKINLVFKDLMGAKVENRKKLMFEKSINIEEMI